MSTNTPLARFLEADDLEARYFDDDHAAIVIIPVPFDGTVTWLPGTKAGPAAIIEASGNLEVYDIETQTEVYRKGIATRPPIEAPTVEEMITRSAAAVSAELGGGKFPVILGGEHTTSIGPVRACAAHYPNLSVLHLDAHTDLRPAWAGSPNNNACVAARFHECVSTVVYAGIRAVGKEEVPHLAGKTIFYAKDIHDRTDWIDACIDGLTDDVYVTIDLDVFDPSLVPGVGTPEPGGLGWYPVLRLLKRLVERRNLVAFDVNELRPLPHEKSSDFLAAKLVYTLLSYRFAAAGGSGAGG